MRVAIVGRSELMFNVANAVKEDGHTISCIITAKPAAEYTKTEKDFRELAIQQGVKFLSTPKLDTASHILATSKSDICVSANYTGIIPQNLIDIFPNGILNVHAGDLPRYRGNACSAWAIINGESEIGLCVHKMVGGDLDSGPIISRSYLAIDNSTKVSDVWSWVVSEALILFAML